MFHSTINPRHLELVPAAYSQSASIAPSGSLGGVKRMMDVAFGVVMLAIFSPVMLVAAALIRLSSPGPILFRQLRIGLGNAPFVMLKFRTMHHHAPDRGLLQQTMPHDPRVTWVGHLLRRTSVDELPQLLNVLRGDMSLVGPRPHAPGTCAGGTLFELVTPYYAARHRVRPGMTGLAQVRGLRGPTETEDKLLGRVEADLEYIANWSLWLDIRILCRTLVALFTTRNAC